MRSLVWLAVGVFLTVATPATAGDAVDLAKKAEAEASQGQFAVAVETMRRALLTIWGRAPLSIRRTAFVTKKAAGFGIYDARANNVFKKGEKLLVYVEPVGYGWAAAGGIFRSDMTADFELKTTKGRVLAGQKAFGRFNHSSRVQNTEYIINLTYSFTGLPAGKFIVGTTLHDNILGKSVSFDLAFEVK